MGELPHLRALVERFPADRFTIFGINTDRDADRFRRLALQHRVDWPNVFAGSPEAGLLSEWGVSGFPTLFVLDRDGVIRAKGVRGKALEDLVAGLVTEGN